MTKKVNIATIQSKIYIFLEKWDLLKKNAVLQQLSNTLSALERMSTNPPEELEFFPALAESARMKLATSYFEHIVPAFKKLMTEYNKLMGELVETRDCLKLIRDDLDYSEDNYYIHILDQLEDCLNMYEADFFVKSQIANVVLDEEKEDTISNELLQVFLLVWNLEPYIDGTVLSESFTSFEENCFAIESILAERRATK